jgi:uncharacterized membrane protein YtjA (UPF0391 family)
MLRWAVSFFIIAIIAGLFGAFGVQYVASEIAWTLFVVFMILFVFSLIVGGRRPRVDL